MIELAHFQVLSAALFAIGLYGVLAKRSAVKGLNGPAVIRHGQGEFGQTIGRKEALGVETVRLEFPNEVTTDVGTHRLGGVHEEPKGTQVEMLQGRRRHLLRPFMCRKAQSQSQSQR